MRVPALPDAHTAVVAGRHLIDPAVPKVLTFVEEVLERLGHTVTLQKAAA